jgi:hypothetical protein
MDSNTIDYIISAEFEAKKGTVITGIYPNSFDLSLENILVEKLMPDGIHNFNEDIFSFRSLMPVNSEKVEVIVNDFNKLSVKASIYINWTEGPKMNEDEDLYVRITDGFVMEFYKEDSIKFSLDLGARFQSEVMDGSVLELHVESNSEDNEASITKTAIAIEIPNSLHFNLFGLIFEIFTQKAANSIVLNKRKGLQTEDRVYINVNFLTAIQIRKEKLAERGAIYKSVTIGTLKYRDLGSFKKYLSMILEEYMDIKSIDEAENQSEAINALLLHYFTKQTDILSHPKFELIHREVARYDISRSDVENNGIHTMLSKFRETFMIIYREMMNEGRIALVGRTLSLEKLNEIVDCLRTICLPLNFDAQIYPYETITSTKLLRFEKSFLAVFNNPIVKFEKDIWTLIVDLDEGTIHKFDDPEPLGRDAVISVDLNFISNFVNLKKVTDKKIFRSFYNYTNMQIELSVYHNYLAPLRFITSEIDVAFLILVNSLQEKSYFMRLRHQIEFGKFEYRKLYGENSEAVYAASMFFKNDEFFQLEIQDDIELLFHLHSINKFCNSQLELFFFLIQLKDLRRLKKFMAIAYANNFLVVEEFLKIVNRARDFSITVIDDQIDDAGFNYKLMMQRLSDRVKKQIVIKAEAN